MAKVIVNPKFVRALVDPVGVAIVPFQKFLRRLKSDDQNKTWRLLTGTPKPPRAFRNREVILIPRELLADENIFGKKRIASNHIFPLSQLTSQPPA